MIPAICTQGTGIGSKGSIIFRGILKITTIWGICSSLDSLPKTLQQIGFGHGSVTARPTSHAPDQGLLVQDVPFDFFIEVSLADCADQHQPVVSERFRHDVRSR
jgi:hypothetical protein